VTALVRSLHLPRCCAAWKTNHVLSSGPFNKIEILPFESRFKSEVPAERDYERTAAIVVDCSSLSRIGSIAEKMPILPPAFIDHHAMAEVSGVYGLA